MLALLASSVSACTCSHHQVEAEVAPAASPCHHHVEMAADEAGNCLSSDDDCVCSFDSEQIVVKSESIKLKKHAALAVVETPVVEQVSCIQQAAKIGFIKPSYLSDSFYNLSPSRGPPSL